MGWFKGKVASADESDGGSAPPAGYASVPAADDTTQYSSVTLESGDLVSDVESGVSTTAAAQRDEANANGFELKPSPRKTVTTASPSNRLYEQGLAAKRRQARRAEDEGGMDNAATFRPRLATRKKPKPPPPPPPPVEKDEWGAVSQTTPQTPPRPSATTEAPLSPPSPSKSRRGLSLSPFKSLRSRTKGDQSQVMDDFESANGYSYDIAMVIPLAKSPGHDDEPERLVDPAALKIITSLQKAGLVTSVFRGQALSSLLFVKIGAPLARLKSYADKVDFRLPLDEQTARKMARQGDAEAGIRPFTPAHLPDIIPYRPFENIYGEFDDDPRKFDLYAKQRGEGLDHPFCNRTRIELIDLIIRDKKEGAGLELHNLISAGGINACFPLQYQPALAALKSTWCDKWVTPSTIPLDAIRDYYGEKVGLYFSFLAHYTSWLFLPGCVSVFFELSSIITKSTSGSDHDFILPLFSAFIALWSVVMLEKWKHHEIRLAKQWGTNGFEKTESDRGEFVGELRESPITGKPWLFFPSERQVKATRWSSLIVLLSVLGVIAGVSCIFTVRFFLKKAGQGIAATVIGSILNSIFISVFGKRFRKTAMKLTRNENHRTDTMFEDAYISKLFLFDFVNNYASFYYVAFIMTPIGDDCSPGSCMDNLALNLFIIFGSKTVIGNLTELLTPLIKATFKEYKLLKSLETPAETDGEGSASQAHSKGSGEPASVAEGEYLLETYDTNQLALDWTEISSQFGFCTLFTAALPLTVLFAFGANLIEMRSDGIKLCKHHRRPRPWHAEDIGIWQVLLGAMTFLAVMTNAGLAAFTAEVMVGVQFGSKMVVFVAFQYVILTVQLAMKLLSNDMPDDVVIQIAREDYYRAKLIAGDADSDDEGTATVASTPAVDAAAVITPPAAADHLIVMDRDTGIGQVQAIRFKTAAAGS